MIDCGKGQLLDPADAQAARAGRLAAVTEVLARERRLAQMPTDGPWRPWQ